ncbi:trypsin-like peptidase domain-containing protein [Cellulomonas composti]|uniref:CHAT domain-containing protein n=1 Tax=Cellulomonas composti TaxID=266130 RepID=A0A511J8H2_9CELL|nr:trypsin-like peptidase domain-containing protein [Cellulomonas composti]GEL94019.1 hypothetical protein CCO02nite_06770 [Cellulomonas composti]
MSDELADLLRQATVRIDVDSEVSGTGFLVAPGKVLTCHHVVKRALERPGDRAIIDVVDPRTGESTRPLSAPLLDTRNDLALLTVTTRGHQPVASLGDVPRIGDDLYTYGYPPTKAEGTSGTYSYEGPEGGPPRQLKIKAGQVQSGLSGAPLLDLRTGTVVGVIRRSRDVESTLGGLAVPVEAAFTAFDRLRFENSDARRVDRRWRDRMTAQQRDTLAGLDRLPAVGSRTLLVDIGQVEERWTVTLSSPSPDLDWADEFRIDLNTLRPDVAKLFRMLKATNRLTQTQQSQVVGETLAKALWNDEARARLRDLLTHDAQVLDVALHFRDDVDEDLLYLPWEALHLPGNGTGAADPAAVWLGADPRTTLVRTMRAVVPEALTIPGPTRIAVFRSPGDQEDRLLGQAADDVVRLAKAAGPVTLMPSSGDEHATALALRDVLRAGPTILHMVARARVENSIDVVDVDDYPWSSRVSLPVEELAEAFAEADDQPALVVLQPVRVSDTEVPPDLSVFAATLLAAGVRAVLAFPLPVDADAARAFFEEFYRRVGEGLPVHVAVQKGRRLLAQGRRHWSFPVLVTLVPGALVLGGGPHDKVDT